MPRADSKQHLGSQTQFYHSSFSNSSSSTTSSQPGSPQTQYLPPSSAHSDVSSASASPQLPAAPAPKKKHVCPTCERAFTTSGHLARHSRVHTGERNHKCPFPGCETRCSRQDNLQQHYRIHLSPGSRRSSTRSAMQRAMNNGTASSSASASAAVPHANVKRSSSTASDSSSQHAHSTHSHSHSQAPLSPPALEPASARGVYHSPPPDSPPPLAQATLPATATHLRGSSSPEAGYSSLSHTLVPMSPHQAQMGPGQAYGYRSGTSTYQEQSQGNGLTYVHTTPSTSSQYPPTSSSASGSYGSQQGYRDTSPSSLSSRHSISHISNPSGSGAASSTGPSSPAGSPHASGPSTPTYPSVAYDSYSHHGQHHQQQQQHASHHQNQHHQQQQQQQEYYSHHHTQQQQQQHHSSMGVSQRFESPPPVLAPIQGERMIRRGSGVDERSSSTSSYTSSSSSSPYTVDARSSSTYSVDGRYVHPAHQTQQGIDSYGAYGGSMGLGHGAWKTETGIGGGWKEGGMIMGRKGVGALVQ